MPRRRQPLRTAAVGRTITSRDRLASDIRRITCDGHTLRKKDVPHAQRLLALPDAQRRALVAALADAVHFAEVGLSTILGGKGAKPKAWTMDIFVRDVCDALRAVGLPAAMSDHHTGSLAQFLAESIAVVAIPGVGQGELFKQMQRSRKIAIIEYPRSKKPELAVGGWRVPALPRT